jgi:Domain of unknown function (DUF4129)
VNATVDGIPIDQPPRAIALAAVATAAVAALPTHLIFEGSGVIDVAVAPFTITFIAAFVIAVVATYRLRRFAPAQGLAIGALVLGTWVGWGDLQDTVTAVALLLMVAAAVASLGLRDWSVPIGTSIVVGGLVIGLECLAATGAQPGWSSVLVLLVPTFVGASLASRAASVWSGVEPHGRGADGDERTWAARAGVLAWLFAAATLLAVAAGGLVDRLGSWLAPIGRAVVSVLVAVVSNALRPLFALFERADIDTSGAERILETLRRNADRAQRASQEQAAAGAGSGVGRVFALLVLAGLVVIAVRLFRRFHTPDDEATMTGEPIELTTSEASSATPPEADEGRVRRHARGELPTDAVRRWYSEVLAAFGARGLEKHADVTPAEFERIVVDRLPQVAADLAPLTRAYEAVRYGLLDVDAASLRALDRNRRSIVSTVRRAGSVGDGDPDDLP